MAVENILELCISCYKSASDSLCNWFPRTLRNPSEEEKIRFVTNELISSLIAARKVGSLQVCDKHWGAWLHCLVDGKFEESNIILERHFHGEWPKLGLFDIQYIFEQLQLFDAEFNQSAECLPRYSVENLALWIEFSLIPELQRSLSEHSDIINKTHNRVDCFEVICDYLKNQAVKLESNLKQPFDSLILIDLAVQICSSNLPINKFTIKEGTYYKGMHPANISLFELLSMFKLQSAIFRQWDTRPSLSDIIEHGLAGLVENNLWDLILQEDEFSSTEYYEFVNHNIAVTMRPLILQFGENMDKLLSEWIQNVVASTVIVYGNKGATSDDDSVLFSRLVAMVSAVSDSETKGSCVLTLMQVSSSVAAANEDHATSLNQLREIAEKLLPNLSPGRTKEAVQESVRLFRLRSLAAEYGIVNFDVRNMSQIRGAVGIISCSYFKENSISDCIEFAEAWNSISCDLSYILGRALISRAVAINRYDENGNIVDMAEHKKLLESAYKKIPLSRLSVAVESCVSYLVDRLDELFHLIVSTSKPNEDVTSLQDEAKMVCSGAATIAALFYDDFTSGCRRNNSGLEEVKISSSGIVTPALLSDLKRIHSLQTDYGIFLCIDGLYSLSVCKQIALKIAAERAEELVVQCRNERADKSVGRMKGASVPTLSVRNRHVSLLLNLSPVFVAFNVMQCLIGKGDMVNIMSGITSLLYHYGVFNDK